MIADFLMQPETSTLRMLSRKLYNLRDERVIKTAIKFEVSTASKKATTSTRAVVAELAFFQLRNEH